MEYKVQVGDTIFSVADKFGVSPQTILDWTPNNLDADAPLSTDSVIMIPGGSPPSISLRLLSIT